MTDFDTLLAALTAHGVGYIIVGGFAATAHGSAFLTVALDIVYDRSTENVRNLVAALVPETEERIVFGRTCRFVNLETLIRLKRAAGRPKRLGTHRRTRAVA